MTLFRSPLLVLDFETTGFPGHDWARAIELGAVLLNERGDECATFGCLIRPDILDERADGALAINHIARADLEAADPTEAIAARFHDWYALLPDPNAPAVRPPYVTSFNVDFDRVFAERMGLQLRGWASCVMLRASDIMGAAGELPRSRDGRGYRWPKLSHAAQFFGVTVDGEPHRAVTDARTAARIAVAIQRRCFEVAA